MKAKQVKAQPEPFKTPYERRAAKCTMCGKDIREYEGISGNHRYCDWKCKLKAHEKRRHY